MGMDDTSITQLIKLFLDKHVSHNLRLLVSLVGVCIAFLLLRNTSICVEICTQFGNTGIVVGLVVVWLVLFITINLIGDRISARMNKVKAEAQRIEHIYDNLNSLSISQKELLERFVLQNKRHFQDYEIGGYKAVWGRDVEVLKGKAILREPAYGAYEIGEEYFYAITATIKPDALNDERGQA